MVIADTMLNPTMGAPSTPRASGSNTTVWLCLGISVALHATFVLWLRSVSVSTAAESKPLLRVAILAPAGGGAEAGGGPPAGPPPVLQVQPAPPAPVKPAEVPKKKFARPRPAVKPAPRAPAAPALERPAVLPSAPAVEAVGGAVSGEGSAAGGSGSSGGKGDGGEGRGSGGGRGGGTGAGSPLGAYLAHVRQQIESAKRYPMLARRSKVEGRASVAFELTRAGEPQHLELRYSDHPLLGEAALSAVRTASPFGQVPEDVEENVVRIEVPLRFSLRDQ